MRGSPRDAGPDRRPRSGTLVVLALLGLGILAGGAATLLARSHASSHPAPLAAPR